MGFLEAFLFLFVTLKLCGTITWSWWFVLIPLWTMIIFYGGLFVFAYWIWHRK